MSARVRTGAAIAAAVVSISMAVATASSADPTTSAGAPPPPAPSARSLTNDCEFPLGGKQVITADFRAQLPDTVAAGQAVTFTDAALKFALPEAMVGALREGGVATLEGSAAVGVLSTVSKKTTAMVEIPKTPLPDKGDLVLDLPAELTPEVKPAKAGTASFTVGPLETLLLPRDAKGEPVPGAKKVTCTLAEGQDAAFGTVKVTPPVSAKPADQPGSGAPAPSSRAPQPGPDKKPKKGKARLQDDPPLCGDPVDPFGFWTYYPLNGHVDVKKLGSGIDFGPGYLSAQLNTWTDPNSGALCNNLLGDLLWPPAHGKFIVFRFMPTEADVTVTQTAPTQGLLDNGVFIGGATTDMRMTNVTVNGTPLDAGPKCHTSQPVRIALHSKPEEWNPFGSPAGFMEADFDIPAFAGCGVGQDLNPLFTGLISGPGNHIRLDFGDIVFCEDGSQPCAPPVAAKQAKKGRR
ncbi:DUF6801 domain-containing protein [Actinocrispum sp. NPDC049592]|uniref:DUF6801 domain-containing protein n=1 Tax=Actinocrispum sp. NPDC049592 TaxID=3154835 RepID=UPI00343A15CA